MKAKNLLSVFLIAGLFLLACKPKQNQTDNAVARVGEKYLLKENLKDLVPLGTEKEDSINMVNNYINKWVRQQLLLQKAELNLPEEKKNVEKQLEDYRNSLLIFAYEKELVRQKLDTTVAEEEIQKYYQENQHEFQLKDYIVKVLYIKLAKDAPKINKVRKWYRSDDEEDRVSLENYCRTHALNFFLETTSWLYLDDLLKEVPIKTYNIEHFLKANKYVELEDEESLYFLRIEDFMLKDSTSPLSLERNKISNIILNERKLQLINKMKEDLYKDAVAKNKFEIFEE